MICEHRAESALNKLGDASLGEWREWGHAFHIRRRLTLAEQEHVGPVVDIRRTPEAKRRAMAIGKRISYVPPDILADEIGLT